MGKAFFLVPAEIGSVSNYFSALGPYHSCSGFSLVQALPSQLPKLHYPFICDWQFVDPDTEW